MTVDCGGGLAMKQDEGYMSNYAMTRTGGRGTLAAVICRPADKDAARIKHRHGRHGYDHSSRM